MKTQKTWSLFLALIMTLGLASCGGDQGSSGTPAPTTTPTAATESSASQGAEDEKPETSVIHWARGNSGNALVTIGKRLGYFDEVGLTIDEIPMDATADFYTALAAGQVDVGSNYGTNTPLQQIASGFDLTIFGGHMLTGCMPIVAKAGTTWNGVQDFVGKRVASNPNAFSITGALLKMGYDPLKDVEWVTYPTHSDRLAAVVSGEVDYAVLGTSMNYTIENMDDIDVLAYCSDVTPNYSCCRMTTRTDFINENPTTIKLLLKALIRAQCYYESHKEEVVGWMAEELGTTEEYVAAYMLNEHYQIHVDPIKNSVINAWNILDETGFLDENAKQINIEDHINTELYKAALDEATAEYGSEDPDFYEAMATFFAENNT